MAYVLRRSFAFLVATIAGVILTACGGGNSASETSAPTSLAAASLAQQGKPKPACAAFTSGLYRLIEPAAAGNQTIIDLAIVTVDGAGTPKITLSSDHSSQTLTPGAAPCSFTAADGSGVVVSIAAVALMSKLEPDGKRYPVLLFPEQRLPLSDLAGTWNQISWDRRRPGDVDCPDLDCSPAGSVITPYRYNYGTFTLDKEGNGASGVVCTVRSRIDLSDSCQAEGGTGRLITRDPAGGYFGTGADLTDGERFFAYKNGTDVMLLSVTPGGSLTLATLQGAISLPAVGTVNSIWNLTSDARGALVVAGANFMPGIANFVNTITSVDTLNSVVVRNTSQDGAAATAQTLHYNVPLAGFRKRDGAVNVSAAVLLQVRGMGLTVVTRLNVFPGTGSMSMAVDHP